MLFVTKREFERRVEQRVDEVMMDNIRDEKICNLEVKNRMLEKEIEELKNRLAWAEVELDNVNWTMSEMHRNYCNLNDNYNNLNEIVDCLYRKAFDISIPVEQVDEDEFEDDFIDLTDVDMSINEAIKHYNCID